ncbi:MAG TPA: ribonuclease P protein component [Phototrophicaceae bacterium]|nr:ribonuclease P protein component [Phototrophicaceae bacterium]
MQWRFRLRNSDDFARMRREGRTCTGGGLLLGVLPNGLEHNRYGFVTSKQVGKAVVRNRVRRLLREAVRQLHPRLKPGVDVVLVARPSLVEKPFSAIQRTVEQLCYQAQILQEEKGAEEA